MLPQERMASSPPLPILPIACPIHLDWASPSQVTHIQRGGAAHAQDDGSSEVRPSVMGLPHRRSATLEEDWGFLQR